MCDKQDTCIYWGKQKEWEEISSVKCEVVDTNTITVPKPGVRYYFSEKTSKEQSWLGEIGAVVLSFCFAGIVPLLCVLFVIGWLSQRARRIFILSFLTLLIPVKVYNRRALKLGMWKWLYEYFSYSIIFEEGFDPDQKYLYAEYPHGVSAPLGCIISGTTLHYFTPSVACYISFFNCLLLFLHFDSLTTKSALLIPIYSAILRWMGSVEATNEKLRWALGSGSCAVVVDGIAGMYVNEPDKEMVKFTGRKGFIRAAIDTGTPIVPVYQFGTSSLLKLVPKWIEPYARKMQCAMGYIVGRWGLPFPHKVVLMTVSGRPIKVEKMDRSNPDYDDYVNEIQQEVADELQRVYYKYRRVYGWGNRPLEYYSYVCSQTIHKL